MNLASKLITCYILILFFPLSMFALYYSNQYGKSELKEARANANQLLINAKKDIEEKIEICAKNAQTILDYSDIMEFMSQNRTFSSDEMINFKKIYITMFSRIHYVNPDVYQFRLFIRNSKFPEIWPFIYSENRIRSKKLLNNVTKLKFDSFWLLNHKEDIFKTTNAPSPQSIVSMYTNVRYPGRKHFATLEVSMLSDVFFSDLYRYSNSKNINFCIVKDSKDIYMNWGEKFFKENHIDKKFIMTNFLQKTYNQSGNYTIKVPNRNLIVQYIYLRPINSYIYAAISLNSLNKKMNFTKSLIILTAIGTFLILALLTYLFTSIILKKMKIIVNSMRQVQQGNLQAVIPITGNDEIGELAHHFRKMLRRINELIDELISKQSAVKDAEIKVLNSQINRHFIYNSLEKLKLLSDERDKSGEVGEAISSLAKIMRYNAKWNRQNVSLRHELDYINNYIKLLNLSISGEIVVTLEIDIEQKYYNNEILKMTIQPIIENAVYHGIEPKGSGMIKISAFEDGSTLKISVTDNGKGMSKEKLSILKASIVTNDYYGENENGIGLKNISNRLKLFYGDEYGLDISSDENIYTSVTISLPLNDN